MPSSKGALLITVLLSSTWAHSIPPVYPSAGLSRVHQRQAEIQVPLAVPTLLSEYGTSLDTHVAAAVSINNSSQATQESLVNSSGAPEYKDLSRMLVMGYYPDWLGSGFPPTRIDFRRFDWIDFAFAVPNADATLSWDDPSAPRLLDKLVFAAHSQGSKIKLSIGGWTGSEHFSAVVATDHSRKTFISNIVAVYKSHQLDGIEIDWEYPGHAGSSSNRFDTDDTANFLLFLRSLRAALPPGARITAAVEPTPFVDGKGQPLEDVSEFAEILDWILIMNYDLWGSSSHPGPNAPLYDACGNSTQPAGSVLGSYSVWTKAKFPASKLVLGLPSYGYISSSTARYLRTRSKPTIKQHLAALKVSSGDGDSDGQVQFRDLILQGALSPINDNHYDSGHGFERLWDPCSCTPYLRSLQSKQVITFDDPTSLGMKAAFAKQAGMLGVNLFDIHGDTDDWILIDAVRTSLGV